MQLLSQFRAFAQSMTPAHAQQQVQQLLQSGQMSNEQFQQLQSQAEQFAQMFGIK